MEKEKVPPIFRKIVAKKITQHRLEGYFYKYLPEIISPNDLPDFKTKWKFNWMKNQFYTRELENLSQAAQKYKITPIILKGASLLETIYSDKGSRHLSDIDIYIAPTELESMKTILKSLGHKEIETTKWEGDQFKSLYTRNERQIELNIELHTKLFYTDDINNRWEKQKLNDSNLYVLAPHHQLVHLIGHLAFQHTFLKLFWLLDIDLYLRYIQNQFNWDEFNNTINSLGFKQSTRMTLWALKKYFKTPIPKEIVKHYKLNRPAIWKLFLTRKFLWQSKQVSLSYYIIKHLTKDSLIEAIRYDLLWMRHRLLRK